MRCGGAAGGVAPPLGRDPGQVTVGCNHVQDMNIINGTSTLKRLRGAKLELISWQRWSGGRYSGVSHCIACTKL